MYPFTATSNNALRHSQPSHIISPTHSQQAVTSDQQLRVTMTCEHTPWLPIEWVLSILTHAHTHHTPTHTHSCWFTAASPLQFTSTGIYCQIFWWQTAQLTCSSNLINSRNQLCALRSTRQWSHNASNNQLNSNRASNLVQHLHKINSTQQKAIVESNFAKPLVPNLKYCYSFYATMLFCLNAIQLKASNQVSITSYNISRMSVRLGKDKTAWLAVVHNFHISHHLLASRTMARTKRTSFLTYWGLLMVFRGTNSV